MKVSIERNSDAYSEFANHPEIRVFLAGSERQGVIYANEERRMAKQYRFGSDGRLAKDSKGEPIIDSFYGDVRIDCPEWLRLEIETSQNPARKVYA